MIMKYILLLLLMAINTNAQEVIEQSSNEYYEYNIVGQAPITPSSSDIPLGVGGNGAEDLACLMVLCLYEKNVQGDPTSQGCAPTIDAYKKITKFKHGNFLCEATKELRKEFIKQCSGNTYPEDKLVDCDK